MIDRHPSSFRDAAGYIFRSEDLIYRLVNPSFSDQFTEFYNSALFKNLTASRLLVSHEEVLDPGFSIPEGTKVLLPEQLPFITYPYEWSFSQLKDAALLTLDICLAALNDNYILKDASAYNVQFYKGRALFIDTLSFEKYVEDTPWLGFRQFLTHFLNPLLLMAYIDPGQNSLLKIFLDGIPSKVVSQSLPKKTYFSPTIYSNVHLHAKLETKYQDDTSGRIPKVKKTSLEAILKAMHIFIEDLRLKEVSTEWGNYYNETNYTESALEDKEKLVIALAKRSGAKLKRVLDLGANDGKFSRAISQFADLVISADVDPVAVEKNYRKNKALGITNVQAMQLDFTNPSPSLGWHCQERMSFFERCKADITICLAFIHHMVITENIPLSLFASTLADLSDYLVIEFVDPMDSQVQRLLTTKKLNHAYDEVAFEREFSLYFTIIESTIIEGSHRKLYSMKKKDCQNSHEYEN